MANKDEIIEELLRVNIIIKIGEDYILTEKYKELLTTSSPEIKRVEVVKDLNQDLLLDAATNGTNYPEEILETTGRTRATLFMNLCEIPTKSDKGYRLRALDTNALNVLGNIIESKDIDPNILINSIKQYYRDEEMPKGFKTFLLDGVVIEVYQEYITEGKDPETGVW